MEASIGRIESHVQHIQFDVTDLRQDVKTVLREIRGNRIDARGEIRVPSNERVTMHVTLRNFPDLGLIVKAATGVIYSNKTGGLASLYPEVEGFFVPLRTRESGEAGGIVGGLDSCPGFRRAGLQGAAARAETGYVGSGADLAE